jgi:two-component system, OmpR family, sensor kinase
MLEMLEGLLRIPAGDLESTLVHASDLIAEATGADKIDAFLYDPARDSLVALGTSNQEMSALQRSLGLNVLQISNGGRTVQVYQTGRTYLHGHVDQDLEEVRGIREALGVRSALGVALEVGGGRRGVLLAASAAPEFFGTEDARTLETFARWLGVVAHRAELAEEIRRNAVEQGRRAGAEELVTVLAHDLRNYLSPMRLRMQMLRHRAQQEARADELGDLDTMFRALGRLDGLVGDILDVARIDQGMFRFDALPVDLGALAGEVAANFSVGQPPVQVSIQQGERIMVSADIARLRQCLENLVANAVQKSPVNAPVNVIVQREVQAKGEARALVHVVDEGPGIPEDMLPHLFDRFVTGRLREGGLGLGLYLAKRIAAAHGGDLAAQSEPGKGARFTLSLPASGTAAAPQGARPASPPG